MDNKNPANINGGTPLHTAANCGHFQICKLIVDNVDGNAKNPADINGYTPLHIAAHNGYLEICQLIVDNVNDKNPVNHLGITPFQLAVDNGHDTYLQIFSREYLTKMEEENIDAKEECLYNINAIKPMILGFGIKMTFFKNH